MFSGISMIKKHLDLVVVVLLVLAIVMYDVTIDWLLSLLHFVLEVLHIMYEWFELGIEHTVEHLFHTTRHGSQIVTFYILVLIACLIIYGLWRVLPRFYEFCKRAATEAWLRRKTELEYYWLSLTVGKKTTLLVTAIVVAYLASFFVM